MQTTSQPNQQWCDMTLQGTGDLERWFEVAELNGAGITDLLTPGTAVELPRAAGPLLRLAERLQVWDNRPASGYPNNLEDGGIDYMQISNDFRVR